MAGDETGNASAGPRRAEAGLAEVGRYFLRLGTIAFGGPAAHIAIMRRELVGQRRWVDDQTFVDLLAAANLIPGPNSTELAMHMGGLRAGWRGVWVAGAAFILPAVAIVLALAWAYVEYGTTPAAEGLLAGVQPVVLAIIVQAIWGLRRAALKGVGSVVIAGGALALALVGVQEVFIIFGAGLLMLVARPALRLAKAVLRAIRGGRGSHAALFLAAPAGYSPTELFFVFLKIGAVLYGSGYVLIAFLRSDLVDTRHWLTEQQLLDAVAVGQFTPGPLFSTATFAGYVIDGWRGAALATLGIFLPSFAFVAVTHPLVPRLRRSAWAAPFLDGANAAALALMGVVTVQLGRNALDGPFPVVLFALAAGVLVWRSPNTAWLVLAGAAAGLARRGL